MSDSLRAARREFTGQPWMPLFLGFRWPSVIYSLDILAWDVLFALAVFSAAPVFGGNRLAKSIRALMIVSGVLAVGGLSGVIAGDMQLRNIGVIGYAGVFPGATALLAILFHRTPPIRHPHPTASTCLPEATRPGSSRSSEG